MRPLAAEPGRNQAGPALRLFPDLADDPAAEIALCAALARARARVDAGPVRPAGAACGAAGLGGYTFDTPRALDGVLAWTIAGLEAGMVHASHKRYFGLFNPRPSRASRCADQIVASFNPQLASAQTSPFPVAVEAHVVAEFCRRAGLPRSGGGHFTSGGSEANMTGLLCALTRAEPGFASAGARAFSGSPRFYVSHDAHHAWLKAAHQAGIGRAAAVFVKTDGQGRMDANALAAAIALDRAQGHVPVMVAATAGTTGAGMIDPLAECGRIARAHGLWFHVDAAWGGALIASDALSARLAGLQHASSVTIDAHKWFATSMACGMFLLREPGVLADVFGAAMDCMPSGEPARDPYLNTAQWSRRFLGLRLFLTLASLGWPGVGRHVEGCVALSERLRALLLAQGWSCANLAECAVLCMLPPQGSRRPGEIARLVVDSGAAWVSPVFFEGRETVRICVCNGASTDRDIAILAASMSKAAKADQ